MKIALVMLAVGDLSGSGGAERQFADLHRHLSSSATDDVYLITSRAARSRLRAAGRASTGRRVIALGLGRRPAAGGIATAWATLRLAWTTMWRRFDLVHLCLPTPTYVPYAALTTHLPRAVRPAVTLTVIDCTVAPNLGSGEPRDTYERQVLGAHNLYFRWTRLDGVYTWYTAFADLANRGRLLPASAVVRAARYCFTDPTRFAPAAKQRSIVWAGRFSAQKRPLLFVDAIAELRARWPSLVEGWRIEMYGAGPLADDLARRIAAHGLGETVAVSRTPDLSPVFGRSRLFVSTQADENFTSLAMLEAMAAGNAVIAEDVGQTSEFVRSGENGRLVGAPTAEAFASAIADYLREPGRHDAMAAASRRLATDVHTIEHFADDIAAFWREAAGSRAL